MSDAVTHPTVTVVAAAPAAGISLRGLRPLMSTHDVPLLGQSQRAAGEWRRFAPVDCVRLAALRQIVAHGFTVPEAIDVVARTVDEHIGGLVLCGIELPAAVLRDRLRGVACHIWRHREHVHVELNAVMYAAPWGGTGQPRRYLDGEVVHLSDRSDNGYIGRSRLSRALDVLAAAAGLQGFSSATRRNAATPSGIMSLPSNISTAGIQRMEAHIEGRYTGAQNGRKVVFVDQGTTFTPMSVSPKMPKRRKIGDSASLSCAGCSMSRRRSFRITATRPSQVRHKPRRGSRPTRLRPGAEARGRVCPVRVQRSERRLSP